MSSLGGLDHDNDDSRKEEAGTKIECLWEKLMDVLKPGEEELNI